MLTNRSISTTTLAVLAAFCLASPGHSQSLTSIASSLGGLKGVTTNAPVTSSGSDFAGSTSSAYAQTDYGANRVRATVTVPLPVIDSAAKASGQSQYSDTFTFQSAQGPAPFAVQYVFTLDGTIMADPIFSTFVSLDVKSGQAAVTGSVATTTNSLAGYVGGAQEDQWGLTKGSSDTYTSKAYSLNGGNADVTVTLAAQIFSPTGVGPGSAAANFGDTALLTGVQVYDANGQLMPNSGLTITSASGGAYPFTTPAPEPSALVTLGFGAVLLTAGAARRRLGAGKTRR